MKFLRIFEHGTLNKVVWIIALLLLAFRIVVTIIEKRNDKRYLKMQEKNKIDSLKVNKAVKLNKNVKKDIRTNTRSSL